MLKNSGRVVGALAFWLGLLGCFASDAGAWQLNAQTVRSQLEKVSREHSLTEQQLDALIGRSGIVVQRNGKKLENAALTALGRGRDRELVKAMTFTVEGTKKRRRFTANQIVRLELDGRPYLLSHVPSKRAYAVVDVQARDRKVKIRLQQKRSKMWETLSKQDQEKVVAEYKEFLDEVGKHFGSLNMQLYETKYFLFYSDMPANQVGLYLKNLDAMNERLGESFGFEAGYNIWRGKAVVVAFVQQRHFAEFEQVFMKNQDFASAQGICHSFPGSGKVIIGCYRGDNPAYFASVLVHETAHGYVHRYKSNRRIPSWLNEGISDWIAGVIVRQSGEVRRRQKDAANRVSQLGTLGDQFYQRHGLERWQYGVASSMVDLLIRAGQENFRVFIDGIKEGYRWEESLQRAYGMTPEALTRLYGQAVGAPNLTH